MPTIERLIKESVNPFDSSVAQNFWKESEASPTVGSIHQDALILIKNTLSEISQDRQSRTILLYGGRGVGKTHFLGRLKETLNDKAFFAYIEPFPASDHIWRHILRHTVDSLVNPPVGQKDSQLMLWLKSCLSTIEQGLQSENQSIIRKIKSFFGKITTEETGERKAFIDILKQSIGTRDIYNANEFFGILYDLTNPNLYSLACEWLKGDSLDEESLKKLQVQHSIDNENSARGILGNFSKISANTQPIVLCFDQLDNIARLPDGSIDLQALFSVNTAIYNASWQGFLIIISILTSTYRDNSKRIQPADLVPGRISLGVHLKPISLDQAEALWASRLHTLHSQATPKPDIPIYPLTSELLENSFPGRQATARQVLQLGQWEIQKYKKLISPPKKVPSNFPPKKPEVLERNPPDNKLLPEFQLIWLKEFQKVEQKVTTLRHYSCPELIQMLQEALSALKVEEIKPKFFSRTIYASHSLSYQQPNLVGRVGLVWSEESHMGTFCSIMEVCKKSVSENQCQTLYLIRAEGIGNPKNKGYKLYTQIFTGSPHRHIKPDLKSVHYLATYHKLVNDACAGELMIGSEPRHLKVLELLVRESNILNDCSLLQKIVGTKPTEPEKPDSQVKVFLSNLIQTQLFLGRNVLIKNATNHFPNLDELQVEQIIQELCKEDKIQIIDEQLICWKPNRL